MGFPEHEPPRVSNRWPRVIALVCLIACVRWLTPPPPPVLPSRGRGGPPRPSATPVSREPLWQDEMWSEKPHPSCSRLRLLTYREGVIAGLTWLYGASTRPLDFDDRRLGKVLIVSPPGGAAPTRLELTIAVQATGAAEIRAVGPKGQGVLRTMPPWAEGWPLDGGADRALDDLPRLVEWLGGAGWKTRAPQAAATLPAWEPGGVARLAEALSPLNRPPAEVGPAQLARAARALAWAALADHRMAPTISVDRAAQALALAAVAGRLAPGPVPEALAARWLAPAAALGDFWMLAATPPPAGDPELSVLHRAYLDPALAAGRPEGALFPAAVAAAARGEALGVRVTGSILDWARDDAEARVLAPYLATGGEFKTVAATYREIYALILGDAVDVLPSTSVSRASIERVLSAEGPAQGARAIGLSRALIRAALEARAFADRVVLQETGERLLRAGHTLDRAYQQYGWSDMSSQLGIQLAEHKDWLHPGAQWLMCRAAMQSPLAKVARGWGYLCVDAARFLPGLIANPTKEIGPDGRYQLPLGQLIKFGDHPAQVYRAACVLHARKESALALSLLASLQRTASPDVIAFYSEADVFTPEVREQLLVPQATTRTALLPTVALTQARRLATQGRSTEALALLTRAAERDRTSQSLMRALTRQLVHANRKDEALAVLKGYLDTRPPGLEPYGAALDLAETLVTDAAYASKVFELSRYAASSAAGWCYQRHARLCARLGRPQEALAALEAEEKHYGSSKESVDRALVEVLSSRGATGWDTLEKRLDIRRVYPGPHARAIAESGIAFPASKFGTYLELVAREQEIHRLRDVAPISEAAVVRLLETGEKRGSDLESVSWCVRAFAGEELVRLLRAQQPARPPALLERYQKATGRPMQLLNVCEVADSMIDAGATDAMLSAGMRSLAPAVTAPSAWLVRSLSDEPAAWRRWVAVAGSQMPENSRFLVEDYLGYLWGTGRDGELVKMVADLLNAGDAGTQNIGRALAAAAGTLELADAHLTALGIKPLRKVFLGVGPDDQGRVNTPHVRSLLAHFRPDRSERNVLSSKEGR